MSSYSKVGKFIPTIKLIHVGYIFFFTITVFFLLTNAHNLKAQNISKYSNTISNSQPNSYSNHTLRFTLGTNISPGGSLEFIPPDGFMTTHPTSTFSARNVQLLVNGVPRTASSTMSTNVDQVEIFGGSPGSILYTLNPSTGISANSNLEFRVGNHTTNSFAGGYTFSTTTGTTTIPADIVPIRNSSEIGTHSVRLNISGGDKPASAGFLIALVESVSTGMVDTRSPFPAELFEGRPEGNVGWGTQMVEMTVRTNKRATCRYMFEPDIEYENMTNQFTTTGLIFHSRILTVVPDTEYDVHVRCEDDEGNINQEDFNFTFYVPPETEGQPTEDADPPGDGSLPDDDGSGDGDEGGSGSEEDSDTGASGDGSGSGGGVGGGGGGGGGGGFETIDGPFESGDARVVINGTAFPNATVNVLVDGVVAVTERANSNGDFSIRIDNISRGVYTFGINAIDINNNKTGTFSTSFSVAGGRTSSLSNIHLSPTLSITPDPADVGDTLTATGQTIPNSEVTLEIERGNNASTRRTHTATSNSNGVWEISIPTTGFQSGSYRTRVKVTNSEGVESRYSDYKHHGIGQEAERPINADLNRDGRVNLIDFSILLFWWGTDGGSSDPPADINGDGRVDLIDFSILLFNWTG